MDFLESARMEKQNAKIPSCSLSKTRNKILYESHKTASAVA